MKFSLTILYFPPLSTHLLFLTPIQVLIFIFYSLLQLIIFRFRNLLLLFTFINNSRIFTNLISIDNVTLFRLSFFNKFNKSSLSLNEFHYSHYQFFICILDITFRIQLLTFLFLNSDNYLSLIIILFNFSFF